MDKSEGADPGNGQHEGAGGGYLAESRSASMGLVVTLPLVVLYQVGLLVSHSRVRNLAEIWLARPFNMMGLDGSLAVNLLLITGLVIAFWKLERRGPICASFLVVMAFESLLYAVLMFRTSTIVAEQVQRPFKEMLSMSGAPWETVPLLVGAGVYEEVLFRLILLGGGTLLFHKVFQFNQVVSFVLMLVISSFAFSAAHYAGQETFESFVFTYRIVCGVFLGLLFITRGLGVAAWTHALYNIIVLFGSLNNSHAA